MSANPYYCITCEQPKLCKCKDPAESKRFTYSHKLRVPTTTENKAKFRKFLDDCPIFVNCVPEEYHEDFRNLLRKVKYTGRAINGHKWTIV